MQGNEGPGASSTLSNAAVQTDGRDRLEAIRMMRQLADDLSLTPNSAAAWRKLALREVDDIALAEVIV